MYFEFMTREVFDTLIFVVIFIGVALAIVRLRADFTRRLDDDEFTFQFEEPEASHDDTQPHITE